ncbi:hypothetical protein I3760_12G040200 [Carya illinoinensis]|nr:hypothetical protein I3760_12G040200 [Carya illinoinensis]
MHAEEIASSIRGKLFQTVQLPPSDQYCSIFRVPKMLCSHNEKAFLPELVSTGPFHHENTQMQAMGNIKLECLKCLLYRTRTTELECLVKAIESIEQDCYKWYAEVPTHQRCSRLDDLVSFSFSKYKMFPAPNSARSHERHTHLLDCFRNCFVGSCTVKRPNCLAPSEWNPVMPVTELTLHEIRLNTKYGDNILDVKFEEGKMKIPTIIIEENSESVFRNLIAFEHCDLRKGYEITSYAALLDCLIKSPADALELGQKGLLRIIGLSNEDRAISMVFSTQDLCQDVNKICSSCCFEEPVAILSLSLGVVASLYLSYRQTYYTYLSHIDSKSKSAE